MTIVERFAIVERMKTVTVSAKYQVVIPKEVRQKLNIRPGQKVRLDTNKKGDLTIRSHAVVDELYGSMKGAWGRDSDAYLRNIRAEANRDRY